MKVLLIEDDKSLMELYKTELELAGAIVKSASDGKSGFALATTENPDLIIMDVILPEKIGLSVLEELKEGETTRHIPVVIMSNYDQGENPEKAVKLGAEAFLSKQKYTPAELIKTALATISTGK